MATWVGTSGYNYPEWRGTFYPERLPASQMLPFYAAAFSTVEINYTFYRSPTEKILAGWADATPAGFRLSLKAPRRITHEARLRDAEAVQRFTMTARTLGPKLGCLLFQLPPYLRCDIALLKDFLAAFPRGQAAALEVRHASWLTDAVYQQLAEAQFALCIADGGKLSIPLTMTAPYAYFRLRDEGYVREDIVRWAQDIRRHTAASSDVYIYFKHEEAGKGPAFAGWLLEALEGGI